MVRSNSMDLGFFSDDEGDDDGGNVIEGGERGNMFSDDSGDGSEGFPVPSDPRDGNGRETTSAWIDIVPLLPLGTEGTGAAAGTSTMEQLGEVCALAKGLRGVLERDLMGVDPVAGIAGGVVRFACW